MGYILQLININTKIYTYDTLLMSENSLSTLGSVLFCFFFCLVLLPVLAFVVVLLVLLYCFPLLFLVSFSLMDFPDKKKCQKISY